MTDLAAAVRSMTSSWRAFLYCSYDAAGLQTVDKPPLALWVQALWAMDRGLRRDGSTKWLLVSGAFVGLGFETKMAAALLVVPGIVAAWLWIARS